MNIPEFGGLVVLATKGLTGPQSSEGGNGTSAKNSATGPRREGLKSGSPCLNKHSALSDHAKNLSFLIQQCTMTCRTRPRMSNSFYAFVSQSGTMLLSAEVSQRVVTEHTYKVKHQMNPNQAVAGESAYKHSL